MKSIQIITIFFSLLLVAPIAVSPEIFAQQPDNPSQEKKQNKNSPEINNSFDKQAAVKKLSEKIKNNGQVRIIVGLDEDFVPEGYFKTVKEKMNQREKFRNSQDALLQEMSSSMPDNYHKFKYIPFMAMTVKQNALDRIISSPMVTSIQEDVPEYATLYESTGIIDVDPEAYNAGFTGSGYYVAILDTGVVSSHPFFSGRVVDQACFTNGANTGNQNGHCPNGKAEQT